MSAELDALLAACKANEADTKHAAASTRAVSSALAAWAESESQPTPAPPQLSIFPSYRLTLPPNQWADSKTGTNAYVNLGGRGSNVVNPAGSPPNAGRIIDTYAEPEWIFLLQFRAVKDEWPWTQGGIGSWFDFFNAHLSAVDQMWANQSWFNVSPVILQLDPGYAKPPAGMIAPLFMLEQWDGLPHYPNGAHVPLLGNATVGDVHDLLVRKVSGSYSMPSWSKVKNPPPSDMQATGHLQAYLDDAILGYPANPTFDSDVFAAQAGQVLDGVAHISTTRVCRNPADGSYWAQQYEEFYEQAYTSTWSTPANVLHWDQRLMAMGTTVEAAYREQYQATVLTDSSIYNGSGTNLGNAGYAPTPDTWPQMRIPDVVAAHFG